MATRAAEFAAAAVAAAEAARDAAKAVETQLGRLTGAAALKNIRVELSMSSMDTYPG